MSDGRADIIKMRGEIVDRARRIEDAKTKERLEACDKAIKAVLEEHGCALQAAPQFAPEGRGGFVVVCNVQVVVKPEG